MPFITQRGRNKYMMAPARRSAASHRALHLAPLIARRAHIQSARQHTTFCACNTQILSHLWVRTFVAGCGGLSTVFGETVSANFVLILFFLRRYQRPPTRRSALSHVKSKCIRVLRPIVCHAPYKT